MTPIELALEFAKFHYLVFPLYRGKNGAKLPPYGWAGNVVTKDKEDLAIPATDDVSIISNWPKLIKEKYKSEVIGFGVTGAKVVILDLDVKGDKNGLAEFKELAKKYKIPPPTMVTKTKSGGLHLYYKRPKEYQDSWIKTLTGIRVKGQQYPSIDLRGDGGFVVGPETIVEDLHTIEVGHYGMRQLSAQDQLPELPKKVMEDWVKAEYESDVEGMIETDADDTDFKSMIRRGLIPSFVPKGARNESFFAFIGGLRSKGIPIEVTRQMCLTLKEKTEEPETFESSVNIELMLLRAYEELPTDPRSLAADIIDRGLHQLVGYRSKLYYAILEDNPYIASRNIHDEASMKVLLKKYEKPFETSKGKHTMLNPITVVTKVIGDSHRADLLGFKPGAGEIFSLHDELGSKKFLNTYRPLLVYHDPKDLDDKVWDEFVFLMTRLFGPKESAEFQLGMDFIAWITQTPETKPSIAPFIMSVNRGVGKSLLFNVILAIMGTAKDGERQARLVKLDEITGRFFNPSGCIINLIDEVQFPVHRDMRRESTTFWRHLKTLITSESVSVEIKGGATYQSPNSAAVALAGNFGSFFPIEEFDRRIWIIDANPPVLERGTVDSLFDLVRRSSVGVDDRNKLVSTLRYRLLHHKIKTDLSSIRAPMTDTKQEMWENSLTDTEEWFVTHFRDTGNLFAHNPIVSMSAINYVYEQSGRAGDRDAATFLRDLKRRGHLRPIKMKEGLSSSRQFTVSTIGSDGTLIKTPKREVLYTTRGHGEFDATDSDKILDLFAQNCATITRWKSQVMAHRTRVSESALTK